MEVEMPEDITDAIDLLSRSEKERSIEIRVKLFKEGIIALGDCVSEHPDYQKDIDKYKLVHTRSLVLTLKRDRPDIDPTIWLDILFTVIIRGKNELKQLVINDPSVKDYLQEFMMLWSDNPSTSEIKVALDDILK